MLDILKNFTPLLRIFNLITYEIMFEIELFKDFTQW